MLIKIKTIWQGKVGIHQKYIKQALRGKENIEIEKGPEFMTIPYSELKQKCVGRSDRAFVDRFSNKIYYLYYFNWDPKIKVLSLF